MKINSSILPVQYFINVQLHMKINTSILPVQYLKKKKKLLANTLVLTKLNICMITTTSSLPSRTEVYIGIH